MSTKIYDKWNKYDIGRVPFINKNKDHPHRKMFVDFVKNNDGIKSVIEIGAGELIEYRDLSTVKKVEYTVVDVSDVFLNYCQQEFPDISIINSSVEDLAPCGDYDICYVASVIEHSKDVKLFIRNAMQLAKRFHFVLFKWNYGGNLKSRYNRKKKYWSTCFNINGIVDIINRHGHVGSMNLVKRNGEVIEFNEYSLGRAGEHRTGDYLVIQGYTNIS